MALKNTSDPQQIAEALGGWLPSVLADGNPVVVSDDVVPQSSGMSSATVLFTAAWVDGAGEARQRELVLRIRAQLPLFRDNDLAREAAVMTAARGLAPIPVPEVVAHETTGDVLGTEFLLLERAHRAGSQ